MTTTMHTMTPRRIRPQTPPWARPWQGLCRTEVILTAGLDADAGAWARRDALRRHGSRTPLVFVTLDEGEARLEFLGQDNRSLAVINERIELEANASSRCCNTPVPPRMAVPGGFSKLLHAAVSAVHRAAEDHRIAEGSALTVCIYLREPRSAMAMAVLKRCPSWVMLCPAKHIALASAYCTIKRARQAIGPDPRRKIGVSVVGADPREVGETLWRLNLLTMPVVGQRLIELGSLRRLGPVASRFVTFDTISARELVRVCRVLELRAPTTGAVGLRSVAPRPHLPNPLTRPSATPTPYPPSSAWRGAAVQVG